MLTINSTCRMRVCSAKAALVPPKHCLRWPDTPRVPGQSHRNRFIDTKVSGKHLTSAFCRSKHGGKPFYFWFMVSQIISMIKCANMKCCLKLITQAVCDPQSLISLLCNMHYYSHYFDLEGIYFIITYCHYNNLVLTGFSCLSTLQTGF